jgi:mannose-6-phosphate isomerase-like protein (cupin superfamily)
MPGTVDHRSRTRPEEGSKPRLQSKSRDDMTNSIMKPMVCRPDPQSEFDTPERCRILESWGNDSDPGVSIARATVAPGVTTEIHSLKEVDERYIIISGTGIVTLGSHSPVDVKPDDIVVIPHDTPQKIENNGQVELVFYCVCTPRFTSDCYKALE